MSFQLDDALEYLLSLAVAQNFSVVNFTELLMFSLQACNSLLHSSHEKQIIRIVLLGYAACTAPGKLRVTPQAI